MSNPVIQGLALVDLSGYLIIAAIIVVFCAAVITNLVIRLRYARIDRELVQNPAVTIPFSHPVLQQIAEQVHRAARRDAAPPNTQAIIEQCVQTGLKSSLVGERFIRTSVGLMIILGLVGTFYGLTSSIGRLVRLVTADAAGETDIAQAITGGLTQALSGMSVAFSTSLFGIVAALAMMLLNVFSNVTDRRFALMVKIETIMDQRLVSVTGKPKPSRDQSLELAIETFGESVARLDEVMTRFDTALQTFSSTTRDFHEFNLHLKDNVQRMSLGFGDFSETLKAQVAALKSQQGG